MCHRSVLEDRSFRTTASDLRLVLRSFGRICMLAHPLGSDTMKDWKPHGTIARPYSLKWKVSLEELVLFSQLVRSVTVVVHESGVRQGLSVQTSGEDGETLRQLDVAVGCFTAAQAGARDVVSRETIWLVFVQQWRIRRSSHSTTSQILSVRPFDPKV